MNMTTNAVISFFFFNYGVSRLVLDFYESYFLNDRKGKVFFLESFKCIYLALSFAKLLFL